MSYLNSRHLGKAQLDCIAEVSTNCTAPFDVVLAAVKARADDLSSPFCAYSAACHAAAPFNTTGYPNSPA